MVDNNLYHGRHQISTMADLFKLDQKLGDLLGRNPLNEPLYRWFYSESWFHLMNMGHTRGARLEQRKMVSLNDVWLLGHWHPPLSRSAWELQYGLKLLYPSNGYYSPTNLTLVEGDFPSMNATDEFIQAIRRNQAKSFADHLADGERIIARREHAAESRREDIIDDACTAFGNDPGKRNGNVSFGGIDAVT